MPNIIDYNAIASSVYQTVLGLNQVASSLIGLDCIWCRLLPYDNGEDVIVQEYTLHQYECPHPLKIVATNTNYQVGNYMVDLWGVHSEVPLEVNVDINTWNAVYGPGTMPQKGDFVLIGLLRKAFEVKSSTIVYTIGDQATSYKCQLGSWQHNANRMETEEFTSSINEMTDSQDRLFGDAISKEVADAVVEVETAFQSTTYVDPLKEYDMATVIEETLFGENGTTFSYAHYNFANAQQDLVYRVAAEYDREVKENHWIYTCWFKIGDDGDIQSGKVTLGDPIKEKDWWTFNINSDVPIEEGDEVTIYRGGVLKLIGTIIPRDCEAGYMIQIATSDCLRASNKVANWWKTGNWKIQKHTNYNIISGYNGDDNTFRVQIDGNNLVLTTGDSTKRIIIADGKSADFTNWHYLVLDMSPSTTRLIIIKQVINTVTSKYTKNTIVDKTIKHRINNFMFDRLVVENANKDISMCNIRLYENEYPVEDTYLIDMYSDVTRNASKCILVDGPIPVNDMSFVTPVK